MKTIEITAQKAASVLKKYGYNPKSFTSLKRCHEHLLNTGAKLFFSEEEKKYYILGYAADGSDVDKVL